MDHAGAFYAADDPDPIDYTIALAAIEAMREPTDAMIWAHEVAYYGPDEARAAWQAMITTALNGEAA
jgi:hypothetical protein